MHPILFHLFGWPVPAFGVMMALAFLTGFAWIARRARAAGLSPDLFWETAPLLILAAVLGARLFYFIFFPQVFWQDPLAALLSRDGLVWYGGMIGLVLAVWGVCRWRGVGFFAFTDVVAPAGALGLALGRVGCFLAGCCYGAPCALPWAIVYPHGHPTHPTHVHPAPLYEAILTLALAFGLARLARHWPVTGVASWGFVLGYGVVRFFMETLRGDRLVWLEAWQLSASQIISLLGIVLAGTMLARLARKPVPGNLVSPSHGS